MHVANHLAKNCIFTLPTKDASIKLLAGEFSQSLPF